MADTNFYNPSLLKFKSIMSSSDQNQPSPTMQLQDQQNDILDKKDDNSISDLVNKLYTPGHEIADKFNEVWSQMPQHEKPSVMRRIVASMVGAGGGIKGADEVLDAPYNEQMSEWTNKLKMLQPLLGDEKYNNTNERMLATNAASQTVANRRADISEANVRRQRDKDAATEALNQDKLKVQQDRAKAYIYKQNNPNHQLEEDENGYIVAINPVTRGAYYITDDDGNKIKSNKLSDADKINLQIKGRLAAARVAGEESRKTEDVREKGREVIADKRVVGQKEVKAIQPGTGTVTTKETEVKDASGASVGKKIETTKKEPLTAKTDTVRMQYQDDKGIHIIRVPKDQVNQAKQNGAIEVPEKK